jgi:hypothetical protein
MKILSNRLPASIYRQNARLDMVTASVTIWRLTCLARFRQLKFHHARQMAKRSGSYRRREQRLGSRAVQT